MTEWLYRPTAAYNFNLPYSNLSHAIIVTKLALQLHLSCKAVCSTSGR